MRTIAAFRHYTSVLPVAVLVSFSVGFFVVHFYVNGNGFSRISKNLSEKEAIEDDSSQEEFIIHSDKELSKISDNTNKELSKTSDNSDQELSKIPDNSNQELSKISHNTNQELNQISAIASQEAFIIPSDEELSQINKTGHTDIIDKYSDHIDILCKQQIRVGTIFDGGKHVCNEGSIRPEKNKCLVYSFGSSGEYSFETDAIRWFGCEVHTFDPFIEGDTPKGCTHHNLGLSNRTETREKKDKELKFESLENIMKMLNHSEKVLDILKIDIEGEEWMFLDSVLDSTISILTNHVKQITIELHFLKKFGKCLSLLRRLRESGFLVFSRERNTFCPECSHKVYLLNREVCFVTEFSYMNERFR